MAQKTSIQFTFLFPLQALSTHPKSIWKCRMWMQFYSVHLNCCHNEYFESGKNVLHPISYLSSDTLRLKAVEEEEEWQKVHWKVVKLKNARKLSFSRKFSSLIVVNCMKISIQCRSQIDLKIFLQPHRKFFNFIAARQF